MIVFKGVYGSFVPVHALFGVIQMMAYHCRIVIFQPSY